jgi:riboflavin biosynthesis pyrimidine reductase
MDAPAKQDPTPPGEGGAELDRLLPPGDPSGVAQIVEDLGLWNRHAGTRRLMLNMVSTVDGRATLKGRSGPLSASADRQLFHGLRSAVDAVLVGAGTVRTERYGRIIADAARRSQRVTRGLSAEPLACIVSGRVALEPDLPLLDEPDARVAILTASAASLPTVRAHVDYIRNGEDGRLDLAAGITELCERFDVSSILCEGGPHLAFQLLAAGLVDELFLSLSPLLAGGEPAGGEAMRILAGGELEPPVELKLLSVLHADSSLFLRYDVSA